MKNHKKRETLPSSIFFTKRLQKEHRELTMWIPCIISSIKLISLTRSIVINPQRTFPCLEMLKQFLIRVSVRRKSGKTGERIGFTEASVRSLFRPDHRQQRDRWDDRTIRGSHRAGSYDTAMGTCVLGLLTANLANSSDH